MTRINVGVTPSELTNKHLIAEHREIKRIPNCIKSGRFSMANQPSQFKLGSGHVKFFYDKILYLKIRYNSIYKECLLRGFKVTDFSDSFIGVPEEYMGDYVETENDRNIILERIYERLNN